MLYNESKSALLLQHVHIYRISLNNSPGVYFLQRIFIPGYKTRQASIAIRPASIKLMYCGPAGHMHKVACALLMASRALSEDI